MTVPEGLPISYELASYLARAAIDLFVEGRDVHGLSEDRSRDQAAQTVAEGASLDLAELPVSEEIPVVPSPPPLAAAPASEHCARPECHHTFVAHPSGVCALIMCECQEFVPEDSRTGGR